MTAFPSPELMDFSASAIVQAAHSTLIGKEQHQTHQTRYNADPSGIVNLVLRLQQRVQQAKNLALQTSNAGCIDWAKQVFNPIVADFVIFENIGLSFEDTEYLLLLATVVVVSYEILILPSASHDQLAWDWLVRAYSDYFAEPDICYKIDKRLDLEIIRLERGRANNKVIHAVQTMQNLMPDQLTCAAAWKPRVHDEFLSIRGNANRHVLSKPTTGTTLDKSRSPMPTFPKDVRIEVYLKPGQSWPFDFVDTILRNNKSLRLKTCIGLELLVEPNFSISQIGGMFDTVHLSGPDDQVDTLAATVIIPPGYAFRLTDAEDVFELEGVPARTRIETKRATLIVKAGDFVVVRRNCHSSILVQSTEC